MQIDERMLKKLLAMDDAQLGLMIQKIAAETGIDPAELGINPQSIESVRSALGSIGEDELEGINRLYEEYRRNKRLQAVINKLTAMQAVSHALSSKK